MDEAPQYLMSLKLIPLQLRTENSRPYMRRNKELDELSEATYLWLEREVLPEVFQQNIHDGDKSVERKTSEKVNYSC